MYADDNKFVPKIRLVEKCLFLEPHIKNVHQWSETNKILLNIKMLVTYVRMAFIKFSYKIDDIKLTRKGNFGFRGHGQCQSILFKSRIWNNHIIDILYLLAFLL